MVEVRKPAKITLPDDIRSLVIVDNTGIGREIDSESSLEAPKEVTQEILLEKILHASQKTYFPALVQFLSEEQFFNNVHLDTLYVSPNIFSELQIDEHSKPIAMNQLDVQAITKLKPGIAVLSVNQMNGTHKWFEPSIYAFDPYEDVAFANLTMSGEIYNTFGDKISPNFLIISDSIFFYPMRYDSYNYGATNISPFLDYDILRDASVQLADKTAKTILPYWQTEERQVYKSNSKKRSKEIDKAVLNDDWLQAAKLWGSEFETEKSADNQSRIAANLALANEMLGDYELALFWINQAIELANDGLPPIYRREIILYKERLQVRLDEIALIKLQHANME